MAKLIETRLRAAGLDVQPNRALSGERGEVVVQHRQRPLGRGPVGNGRKGDSFWIIAEHGRLAGWVHNIRHDPRVRVRLRIGLRYRWVAGVATVRPDDDTLARQRQIIAWHPLRAYNAINVRALGADLLVVHILLQLDPAESAQRPQPVAERLTAASSS